MRLASSKRCSVAASYFLAGARRCSVSSRVSPGSGWIGSVVVISFVVSGMLCVFVR